MTVRFKDVLSPPVFAGDEDKTLVAGQLNAIVWVMLASTLLYGIALAVTRLQDISRLAVAIPLLPLFVGVLWLIHHGRTTLAAEIIVAGTWVILVVAAIFNGGVRGPAFSGLVVVVLTAGILLGQRAALGVAGVSIATGLAMVYAESRGILPPAYETTTLLVEWMAQAVFFVVAAALLYLATSRIDQSLARARQELAERKRAEQDRLKFTLGIERSDDAIFITETDGTIVYVNPGFEKMYGYAKDEALGKTPRILKSGTISQEVYAQLWQTLLNKQIVSGQVVNKTKDGRFLSIATSANPIVNERGDLLGFLAIQRDVTERERAEQALRESEDRFRSFVEHTFEWILMTDEQGTVVEWNRGAERVTGLAREQAVGKPVWDVHYQLVLDERRTPATYDRIKSKYLEALRTGNSSILNRIVEAPFRRTDGTVRIAEQWLFPITTAKGFRLSGISRDITERKRAEEELRKLSRAVDQSPVSIIITDTAGTIEYVNPKFSQVTGYSREEAIGTNPRLLKSGDKTPEEYKTLWDVITGGDEWRGEFHNKKKNGELFWENASISPVTNEAGKITHFLAVKEDITEQKRTQEQIQVQLRRLSALHAIDIAITGNFDLRVILNIFLEQVTSQLGVDAAAILLLNAPMQTLDYIAGRGFHSKAIEKLRSRLNENYAGRAALQRTTVHVEAANPIDSSPAFLAMWRSEGFVSYYAVPLIAKGQVKGVLQVFHRTVLHLDDRGHLGEDWLPFLETLGTQAAIAIENASLFTDLQRSNLELTLAYDTTLEGWSRALDLRDKETEGHTERVVDQTLRLARLFGIGDSEMVHVRRGALLHDIGKMGIPDGILLKPGPLTEEEWEIMRKHPMYAYELLSPISFLRPALDIPYCHHERWDGTGYPRGLHGNEIPLIARIFSVVDVWDALCSDRPYRKAWSKMQAREHIREGAGKHFDPKVVEVFLSMLDSR
jgi:PAS domain S-box-containing protein